MENNSLLCFSQKGIIPQTFKLGEMSTATERIKRNGRKIIADQVIQKGFCMIMKPQAEAITKEINEMFGYNFIAKDKFTISKH